MSKRALGFLLCLVVITAGLIAILWPSVCFGQSDDPATPNIDESLVGHHSDINVTDSGWGPTYSVTQDCAPGYNGWGEDRWILTVTQPRDLTVRVKDCCCPGDFYEIYVSNLNKCLIGTTPQMSGWGCAPSPPGSSLSDGSFTVSLQAGTYIIEIRDAGFDGHDPAEIEEQDMCPAGYWVTGTLGTYTGKPWPCTPTISMVNPNSGIQGETLGVTITGTHLSGTTSVSFGLGIDVTDFDVNSATEITASISINGDATPGTRNVSVTTPEGTATKPDAFTVVHAPCTITASAGAHGSISPSGTVTVSYGADQTFIITPDPNYHINTLTVDGSPVTPVTSYIFINVTENHTISATFVPGTLTITASAGDHGSISPSGAVTVYYGDDQTFIINPDTGYHIDTLTADGSPVTPVGSYTFSNVTENHTISATFAITTFTITASAGAHGSIDPSGAVTVNYGGEQTFTITPDSDYLIATLTVDGSPITPVSSYTFSDVTAGHTVSATFALTPPIITSVSPDFGVHLQSLIVTITGNYFTSATSVSFGSGITVNAFTVDSATQITADISVSSGAPIGWRDISVTTPAGTSTKTEAFSVNLTQTGVSIISISPNQGSQRQSLSVTITGTYLSDTLSVSFGSSITIDSFTVDSLTQITANISISSTATAGARDVSVTTSAGTVALVGGFTVLGAPPASPLLLSPGQDAQMTGTEIAFEWEFDPSATKYWLEVNADANWSKTTRLYYGYASSTGQMVEGFLNDYTTYYWRVHAGNDYGWSEPTSRSFSNVPLPPPASPNLISPDDGAIVGGNSILFEWEASADATQYWLQVNTSPTWDKATRIFYGAAAGTSQLVSGFPNPPSNGPTYYWRVHAGSSWGWSTPSSRSFVNLGPPVPGSPVLTYPNNEEMMTSPSITFQWQPTDNATKYWLDVNRDPNFGKSTRFFYGNVGDVTSKTLTGFPLNSAVYYWKVTAGNVQGWGNPSSRTFNMLHPPTAPDLTSPVDGAIDISYQSITFSWTAPPLATTYWIHVNTDVSFGTTTRVVYTQVSDTSYTATNLNPATAYYWKVCAGNLAGWGPYSYAWTFTTASPPSPPPAPTLIAPADTSYQSATSITFTWNPSPGAAHYWLQVNTSSSFTSSTRFFYADVGDVTSKTITGFPNIGTTYYWKVCAGNAQGWGAYSTPWSFINRVEGNPPNPPTLISPADTSHQSGTSITFTWSTVDTATHYWLQVNTSPAFGKTTRFFYADVGDVTSKTITGFPNNGTTYYWKVVAGNAAGWGDYSTPWSFINP